MDQKKNTMDEKKKRIKISPVTRLEGHGEINIFLDDEGNVENAYFQATEFRGFEWFCQGRPVEEMPRITTRLCAVCLWAHHIASTKCLDDVFKVEPPFRCKEDQGIGLRRPYDAQPLCPYLCIGPCPGLPDWFDGPPSERNLLDVIKKVGLDMGKVVIKNRYYAQKIQDMIGGKTIHPVFGLPGGISHPIMEGKEKR